MKRIVDHARRAYDVIAPPGRKPSIKGGVRAEAWVSLLLCVAMAIFSAWWATQAASWALATPHVWIAVLAWVGFALGVLAGLFFVGLTVIVALGRDLGGRVSAHGTRG